ncbi:hypothetical protein EV188_101562 [Actinomycetospora succinea]|uniref:Small secreted domain DUF320 n=1 Tax=Actinomycetospora succinea TaxID=663603 RepID=A0A4R6VN78_9PSEU|nr:hypothetical protein [Actinomycetospora succinea]TDQ65312.1 hypothetical protein EV188_101562 [Actinomycetospora succinea]
MFKKLGTVAVGVAAGLLVAAPFASASECHEDSDHHESSSVSSDDDCNINGGNASAASEITGDSGLGNLVGQSPIAGNIANVTCSEILSNNLSGNSIDVL